MLTLTEIRIYPVKALRGLSLATATVNPWGLTGDRRWMVVDETGRFITQRETPKLATLTALLREDGLTLCADGEAPLDIPFPAADSMKLPVVVWGDTVTASLAAPQAADWLSRLLDRHARLVFMANPQEARLVSESYRTADEPVTFADGFPLLATSSGSLEALNASLAHPVPMDRFRTNITISGAAAWDEDSWVRLRVGSVLFRAPKPCARCTVVTTDQMTGERPHRNEPLKTLAAVHRDDQGRIIFGQNLIPETTGTISVGDPVEILERRS